MVKSLFKYLILALVTLSALVYFAPITHYNAHLNKRVNRSPAKEGSLSGIIRVVDYDRGTSCSAFVVDDSFAITAGHCIKNSQKSELKVFIESTQEYITAQAAAYDEASDTGFIYGNFSDFTHLNTNYSGVYNLKHPLVACGYPRGQKELFCSDFVSVEKSLDLVRGYSEIYHGMSGGPVIDTVDNIVIGIVHAIDEDGYSYFVPTIGLFGTFPELE